MAHVFGGKWTEQKLQVMERYFSAYAIALKNAPFERWYVDAFAGTGERTSRSGAREVLPSLFGEDEADVQETKEG